LPASILNSLPAATCYYVAYSGGVDSHVLLHLLATHRETLRAPLGAVHVNHGIQPQADGWVQHCRTVCEQLEVTFDSLQVNGKPCPGESPEAAARQARYRALAGWLPPGAVLLTAQHRDDQAETLLLQLFRGAGPRGLAAMPALTPLGRGVLARPLLSCTRQNLFDYAHRHRLDWVDDPSNDDLRYVRNRLRHQLMPPLRQTWPGLDQVLTRVAGLQAEQAELARALAGIDQQSCVPAGQGDQLDVAALQSLSPVRQRNLLRHWLENNGLPLPGYRLLGQLQQSMVGVRPDASPCVRWPGAEIRYYRNRLYALTPLPGPDPTVRLTWEVGQHLSLPLAGGALTATMEAGQGLCVAAHTRLEVRFRQGGESLQPAGRREHHRLKKLFQEWQVPPWERMRVPLLYQDGKLAAVAGLCVCEGFQADGDQPGYRIDWSRLSVTPLRGDESGKNV